jgi:hypothetical protein
MILLDPESLEHRISDSQVTGFTDQVVELSFRPTLPKGCADFHQPVVGNWRDPAIFASSAPCEKLSSNNNLKN